MRSAALKYDIDGRVAWDRIWGSFCDLAMAGGQPHKGTLLEPGTEAEIDAQFGRYDEAGEEITGRPFTVELTDRIIRRLGLEQTARVGLVRSEARRRESRLAFRLNI